MAFKNFALKNEKKIFHSNEYRTVINDENLSGDFFANTFCSEIFFMDIQYVYI